MTTEDTKAQALQKLKGIIEEALRYGADVVELEYADGGLEINYLVGQVGLGHVLTDHALARELLRMIVELAGLEKKSRGVMAWTQAGKTYRIRVEEYDSFGETAWRLTLGKPQSAGKSKRPGD